MRSLLLFFAICMAIGPVIAQEAPVKIVFDMTSGDLKAQQSAIRHIKMMSQGYPDAQFEMVMYGGAMDMVLEGKSPVGEDMKDLVSRSNVTMVICEGTMKRHNVEKSALIPGVQTVPDGIMELVMKQRQGWSYIKEGGP